MLSSPIIFKSFIENMSYGKYLSILSRQELFRKLFAQYGRGEDGGGGVLSIGFAVSALRAVWERRALLNGEKLPGEDVGVFYLDEVKVLSEYMVGET